MQFPQKNGHQLLGFLQCLITAIRGLCPPNPLGFIAFDLRRQAASRPARFEAGPPAVCKVASALELHPCRALSSEETSKLCGPDCNVNYSIKVCLKLIWCPVNPRHKIYEIIAENANPRLTTPIGGTRSRLIRVSTSGGHVRCTAFHGRCTPARPASHVWNASVDVPRRTRRNASTIRGACIGCRHRTSCRDSSSRRHAASIRSCST
jgi:hypothetical protein